MASCLPATSARAVVVPGPLNDTLSFHATGLPPFAGFDLFATASPSAPYGVSWPLGIAQADAQGTVDIQVQALLLGASTLADSGAGTPTSERATHLVLFFDTGEDAASCLVSAGMRTTQLQSGRLIGPAALATVDYPYSAGPLAVAPFAPPGRGIAVPGGRLISMRTTFTTACDDPVGWTAIRFIDFRLSIGGTVVFWARLDRPAKRMYLYDAAAKRWVGGLPPGSAATLSAPLVQLVLQSSKVLGTAGTKGRVLWTLQFSASAAGQRFLHSVRVIDVRNQTLGWTDSGTWSAQ
jgi:hypothetical protein